MSSFDDNNLWERDERPQKGAWAPGSYMRKCYTCSKGFIGGQWAYTCANCAYESKAALKPLAVTSAKETTSLETLKGMLNDPDGNCSVRGTVEDRRIIGEALRGVEDTTRELIAALAELKETRQYLTEQDVRASMAETALAESQTRHNITEGQRQDAEAALAAALAQRDEAQDKLREQAKTMLRIIGEAETAETALAEALAECAKTEKILTTLLDEARARSMIAEDRAEKAETALAEAQARHNITEGHRQDAEAAHCALEGTLSDLWAQNKYRLAELTAERAKVAKLGGIKL
jgi:chromosome segregation ATPase